MAKGTTNNQPAAAAPGDSGFQGVPGEYVMPPGMPWHNDQMANTLAAGYGGSPQVYRDYLAATFRPMTFKSFQPVGQGAAPRAAMPTTGGLGAAVPTNAFKAPPGFSGPIEQMISRQISAGGQY